MAIQILPIVRCVFSWYMKYLSCWYDQEPVVETETHIPFHTRYLNAHISAWHFIRTIITSTNFESYEQFLSNFVGISLGILIPLFLLVYSIDGYEDFHTEFLRPRRIRYRRMQYRNIPQGIRRLTRQIKTMYELNEKAKTLGFDDWYFGFVDAFQVHHVAAPLAWDLIQQRQRLSAKFFEVDRELTAYGFRPKIPPTAILRAARRLGDRKK